MFHFKNLFTWEYLFPAANIALTKSDKLILLFGGVSIGISIVLRIVAAYAESPIDRKYLLMFYKMLLTIGILEALWFGGRYQNVMFFGSRFVALIILLIGLVWLIFILVSFFKHYSADSEKWRKQQVKLKYLKK